VTALLLTIRLQNVVAEDGGEAYLRARIVVLRRQSLLEPKRCCVFNYGR